jgi:NADH dehydrogenase/NADH:ubiquinone oxidoreductase subunit G
MSQYVLTSIILTALGTTDILNGIGTQILLQSMSMTAGTVTGSIKELFSKKNKKNITDIKKLLGQVDIQAEIEVLKSFMLGAKQDNPGITKAWENLNESINEIVLELEVINKKVKQVESSYQVKLWLTGTVDFTINYEKMESLIHKFNRRLDLLVKVMK